MLAFVVLNALLVLVFPMTNALTSVPVLYRQAHKLKECNQLPKAIEQYDQILNIEPDHAWAQLGRAQCYLTLGELTRGWPGFEFRGPAIRNFTHYQWDTADLSGKRIVLRAEWGLGDCIQFIRYAQLIKARGGSVIAQTYEPLVPLFKRCPCLDCVVTVGQEFPEHDIQVPLLSLPYTFNTTLSTIPRDIPYLFADETLIEQWRDYFDPEYINIGLCWHGSGDPQAPAHINKNIPIDVIMQLADIPGVRLYSLQQQTGLDALPDNAPIEFFDASFDATHGRFMDTAAVMMHLDFVITVDTSIAHLAGALGVSTYVLLPYKADWRWMNDRTDSPWYPTMKLFRQSKPGDWQSALDQIKKFLYEQKRR